MMRSESVNWNAFLLLTIFTSIIFLLIQRSEAKRRRLTVLLMIVVGGLFFYWASVRGLTGEFVTATIAGLLLNLLFWLLVGRYNPVKDSDDVIQVIGMDD